MKRKLLLCKFCNKETIHLVGKKMAHKRDNYYRRREIKHCCSCGCRTIENMKQRKTYIKYKGNKVIKNEMS